MRAVAVAVDRRGGNAALAVGEIVERGNAIDEIRHRCDAGVDHGDADPVARRIHIRQTELLTQLARLLDRARAARGEQRLRGQRIRSNRCVD